MKILKTIGLTLFLFQSTSCTQIAAFDLKGKLDSLTGGGSDSSEAFDLKGGKTQLMEAFYESAENYRQALIYLKKAYKINVDAAQSETTDLDSNASEADKMENYIKATTESSLAVEKRIKEQGNNLSAEGKIVFAKSLPFAGKGLVGTIKLAPISGQMVKQVSANPLSAFKEIGGVSKVIPQLPQYMLSIQKVTKLIVTSAKANDIKVSDDLKKGIEIGELE